MNALQNHQIEMAHSTLLLLNFTIFAFWKKIAKINNREKKRALKLKWRNLIPYFIRKQYIHYKG